MYYKNTVTSKYLHLVSVWQKHVLWDSVHSICLPNHSVCHAHVKHSITWKKVHRKISEFTFLQRGKLNWSIYFTTLHILWVPRTHLLLGHLEQLHVLVLCRVCMQQEPVKTSRKKCFIQFSVKSIHIGCSLSNWRLIPCSTIQTPFFTANKHASSSQKASYSLVIPLPLLPRLVSIETVPSFDVLLGQTRWRAHGMDLRIHVLLVMLTGC